MKLRSVTGHTLDIVGIVEKLDIIIKKKYRMSAIVTKSMPEIPMIGIATIAVYPKIILNVPKKCPLLVSIIIYKTPVNN